MINRPVTGRSFAGGLHIGKLSHHRLSADYRMINVYDRPTLEDPPISTIGGSYSTMHVVSRFQLTRVLYRKSVDEHARSTYIVGPFCRGHRKRKRPETRECDLYVTYFRSIRNVICEYFLFTSEGRCPRVVVTCRLFIIVYYYIRLFDLDGRTGIFWATEHSGQKRTSIAFVVARKRRRIFLV